MAGEKLQEIMEKVPFSHEIDPQAKDLFDDLAESLPGKKYEILEAMIHSFATLPRSAQVAAIGGEWDAWKMAADSARRVVSKARSQAREPERPETDLGTGAKAG